ncbi:MAG TPA: YtxH domain-containing protein [Myxococcota bacterium]|nr:YtxH domain-containing protein [Myxococcota bacterium]
MTLQEIIDQLPPKQDLVRLARSLPSRGPSRSEVILYGIGGALLGAGLALLFAPTAGSELRTAISDRIEEYWNGLESLRSGANGSAAQER